LADIATLTDSATEAATQLRRATGAPIPVESAAASEPEGDLGGARRPTMTTGPGR
jgi:hypothetical protein